MNLKVRSLITSVVTICAMFLSQIPAQAALVTVNIKFLDASGHAIRLGQAKWALNDNSASSASAKNVSAEGKVSLPYVKPGVGKIYISRGFLSDGSSVNATWLNLTLNSGPEITLQLSQEPVRVTYKVFAVFPDGSPVSNTTITETGLYPLQSICDSSSYSIFAYNAVQGGEFINSCPNVSPPTHTFVTDNNGFARVEGFLVNDAVEAYATYSDSELNQSSPTSSLNSNLSNYLQLEFMPVVDVPTPNLSSSSGALLSVPISVGSQSQTLRGLKTTSQERLLPTEGVSVRVTDPDGLSPSKCGKKVTKMFAITDGQGKGTFKICALKSGYYNIQANGAVSTKRIKVFVKKSKPTLVKSIKAVATGPNKVVTSWSAPDYAGGLAITKYIVQAYSGSTVKTVVLKKGTKAFKARKYAFTKLSGNAMWDFSVVAVNKSGKSPIQYASKSVIVSNIR